MMTLAAVCKADPAELPYTTLSNFSIAIMGALGHSWQICAVLTPEVTLAES